MFKNLFLFIKIKIVLVVLLNNFTTISYSENWFTSSGDYHSSKFSNLETINDKNVQNLKNIWTYKNGFSPSKKESLLGLVNFLFTLVSLIQFKSLFIYESL